MTRITREALEACLAFGTASLAVAEVAELLADRLPDPTTADLFAELQAAHCRLRNLFANGQDAAVHGVALSVPVLAERTNDALGQEETRPGE